MFTVALEGEKTKPKKGDVPTASGKHSGGCPGLEGVRGFLGRGLSLGGKPRGCTQVLWQVEAQGELSSGSSFPKERAWLGAGIWVLGVALPCLLWVLDRSSQISRPQVSPSLQSKAESQESISQRVACTSLAAHDVVPFKKDGCFHPC